MTISCGDTADRGLILAVAALVHCDRLSQGLATLPGRIHSLCQLINRFQITPKYCDSVIVDSVDADGCRFGEFSPQSVTF